MMQRSSSITGPYLERKQLSHVQREYNEPNQGGLVEGPDRKWYFFTHHGTGDWAGRIASLLPVYWVDGWPIIGEVGQDGIGTMVWQAAKPSNEYPVRLHNHLMILASRYFLLNGNGTTSPGRDVVINGKTRQFAVKSFSSISHG